MGRALRVDKVPEGFRRSRPVNVEAVDQLHAKIASVRVTHGDPDEADGATLRAQFVKIRDGRNTVARIVSRIMPRLGKLRSDVARLEAVIAAEGAELALPTSAALDGCRNEGQRKALLRDYLRSWHEARDAVAADLLLVEAVLSHARWVREELKYAFEEASRSLSSVDLEHRFER